jgi:hypothetical protein
MAPKIFLDSALAFFFAFIRDDLFEPFSYFFLAFLFDERLVVKADISFGGIGFEDKARDVLYLCGKGLL